MMTKKKYASFLLVASIILTGLLAGCGAVEDENQCRPDAILTVPESEFDLTDLDQAISDAIFITAGGDARYEIGECFAEGHQILDQSEEEGQIIVCAHVIDGWFGFENNIFTGVSGSSIPTRLMFSQNAAGEYILQSYDIPEDGSNYGSSLRALFSAKALAQLERLDISSLYPQLEAYAEAYLQSIGREATVQWHYVDRQLPDMDSVQVSNALLERYSEYPYWIGSLERVEDGTRMVYEHLWQPDGAGGGITTYQKQIYGGDIVERHVIEVSGDTFTEIDADGDTPGQ